MTEKTRSLLEDIRKGLIVLLIINLLCALLCGCKSSKVVAQVVERVKTDSIYIHDVKRDSVLVKDSVFVKQKGDTVWMERWRKERIVQVKDSIVYKERVDTIPVVVPVEIEKQLSLKEKLQLRTGKLVWQGGAVLLVIGVLTAIVFYILRRFNI